MIMIFKERKERGNILQVVIFFLGECLINFFDLLNLEYLSEIYLLILQL